MAGSGLAGKCSSKSCLPSCFFWETRCRYNAPFNGDPMCKRRAPNILYNMHLPYNTKRSPITVEGRTKALACFAFAVRTVVQYVYWGRQPIVLVASKVGRETLEKQTLVELGPWTHTTVTKFFSLVKSCWTLSNTSWVTRRRDFFVVSFIPVNRLFFSLYRAQMHAPFIFFVALKK